MDSSPISGVLQKTLVPLLIRYFPIFFTILVAWITVNQLYFKKQLDNNKKNDSQENDTQKAERKHQQSSPVVPSSTIKTTKKKQQNLEKWTRDNNKQNFKHDWLLTSLKGHSGTILDMDFSANGKFLATCADGDDPGGSTSGSSSGSEANKENASPELHHRLHRDNNHCNNIQLTRRQKKNRIRKEEGGGGGGGGGGGSSSSSSSSSNGSPQPHQQPTSLKKRPKKQQRHQVLRQYAKLNLNDADLFKTIKQYVLHPEDLLLLGYPVESRLYPGRAMIFRSTKKSFDVNAKEFIPRANNVYPSLIIANHSQKFDYNEINTTKSVLPTATIIRNNKIDEDDELSEEKRCVRCSKTFFISSGGEYLTQEHCMYHWGKLMRPCSGGTAEAYYNCCKGKKNTKGCTTAKLHVWNGIDPGRNGPFDGYVRTRPKKTPPNDGNYGIYALDCEMCYTTKGLELTKISVVAHDGKLVYDTFVRPESYIIDYNTRFSGITAKDLSKKTGTKYLKDVQNDLMGFITADTILVGHGLENDLRALRMIHTAVVDTAIVFPHVCGLPFRRSLKSLVNTILKRDIQSNVGGHDSCEDARSCLELILWKIRKDRIKDDNIIKI